MIKLRRLLALLLLLQLTCCTFAADAKRPNIVYLLVDDMGRNDCGFMGGTEIKTPRIDKLAPQGATLDSFYVQPVCSPTRAAFLTGRYPMRYGLQTGVVKPWAEYGLALEETTLADDLQAAGYETAIFGKWHLGEIAPEYLPTKRGFMHQYGHYNGAIDYFTHDRDGGFDWHKDDKVCRDEGYSTDLIGENAVKFVNQYAGKKPFFLYVPFNGVHSPYQPPKGGIDAYPGLKGERQNYAAMLTSVDQACGKIIDAIDKAGIRDNTLILFSSDNGGPEPHVVTDNGKYRGGKGGLYEGGVRVAGAAIWDGHIKAGSTIKEPMHVVDFRPTLEKLCGAKHTGTQPMDGLDILPTLTAGAPSPHTSILLNTTPSEGAIRMGDWKLIVKQPGPGPKKRNRKPSVELYNLESDPYEKKNAADSEPDKVKKLQHELERLAAQATPPKARPMPKSYKAPKVWGETD